MQRNARTHGRMPRSLDATTGGGGNVDGRNESLQENKYYRARPSKQVKGFKKISHIGW